MQQDQQTALEQLQHIRTMMDKSSRFISLSGWSGISAGTCAIAGAIYAYFQIDHYYTYDYAEGLAKPHALFIRLSVVAAVVFIMAALLAIFFTYQKSKKDGTPLWGEVSQRLLWNTGLPIAAGGIFILKMISQNCYDYVAAACLLFYGLGLINGSKYTLGEVRFLGYAQVLLGLLSLFYVRQGLFFWALGFGVCHIVYGIMMWRKYEH